MPDGKKGWDLTSNNSLRGAAGWLLKNSGAVCVIVFRREDMVVVADPSMPAHKVQVLLEENGYELTKRIGDDRVDYFRAQEAKRKKEAQRGR